MTNAKEFFASNFLKAEDCKGGEIVEIVGEDTLEDIKTPEGKMKKVMNFPVKVDGKDKIFTPNMTNGDILIEAFGEDTAKWVGKKFTIKLLDTIAFGKKAKSILVEQLVPEKK